MRTYFQRVMMRIFAFIVFLTFLSIPLLSAEKRFTADNSDEFGDIIRTIPSPQPALNNSFAGLCWAEGYLYLFENVFPATEPTLLYKINSANGVIADTLEMPFTGYVMDCDFDGVYMWVVKWFPSSFIYQLDLTGNIISQFALNVGNYTPRCIIISDSILWIGANLSENNTKLYRFNLSGTLLGEYVTNNVIGWYMGGVKDTDAVADSGFFVVDNIGNSLKHFTLFNNTAILLEQFPSPVNAPDLGVGLAFDGDYLWHSSAIGLQNLIWCIDDGLNPNFPEVTIQMVPSVFPVVIPATGGNFNYTVNIHNGETIAQTFTAWIIATLPTGSQFQILQRNLTLGPSATLLRNMTQSVPAFAPPGTYNYEGFLGLYPDTIWDEDGFNFTKLGIDELVEEINWDLSGWEGNILCSSPPDFEFKQNYPNPFNAQTTIEFALAEDCAVNLRIYNTRGEEISTLLEGFLNAGYHSVIFNSNGLASGIYIYTINTGKAHLIRKMMIIK